MIYFGIRGYNPFNLLEEKINKKVRLKDAGNEHPPPFPITTNRSNDVHFRFGLRSHFISHFLLFPTIFQSYTLNIEEKEYTVQISGSSRLFLNQNSYTKLM